MSQLRAVSNHTAQRLFLHLFANRHIGHLPLNEDARRALFTIAEHLYILFESAWHLVGPVVGDNDFARGTRSDKILGVIGYGASARSMNGIDDKLGIANIGEGEGAFLHRLMHGENTHINDGAFKLELRVFLGLKTKSGR